MDPLQRVADALQAYWTKVVELSTTTSGIAKDSRNWLLEPQQKSSRVYPILKCMVYALTGIALTLYIGWKGLELAQATLDLSKQANGLAVKSICNGENLTVDDRAWCSDPTNNRPLSSIMESIASHILATQSWVYSKLTAAGLCGTYTIAERSGETCLGLGILLLAYFFTRSNTVDKLVRLESMYECLPPIAMALATTLDSRHFRNCLTYGQLALCLVHPICDLRIKSKARFSGFDRRLVKTLSDQIFNLAIRVILSLTILSSWVAIFGYSQTASNGNNLVWPTVLLDGFEERQNLDDAHFGWLSDSSLLLSD